jgi:cyclic pyranopterin phosphate synthase
MPPLSGIPNEFSPVITDSLQRPLRDLRISVTDRCNMRCTYCMPRAVFDDNYAYLPRTELLTFEEIERVARVFADLGVQKIRLTGGEPLLRRGIEKLIERLATLRTLQGAPVEIALTTNAVLLTQKAQALKSAGLNRLTVSLDSLSDATFKRMTDSDTTVATVLEGIAAAKRAGFTGIKVNMVVRRGVNDAEILPMAEHFRHSGVVLRFIEYMDVGCSNSWRKDDMVSASEILAVIASRYPVRPVAPDFRGEVAERWRYDDGAGEVGVIASVTQAFCRDCTRMRLSTDGKLFTCLFASAGTDIRSALRPDSGDESLARIIIERWRGRDDRYSELRHLDNGRTRIEMSYIGG